MLVLSPRSRLSSVDAQFSEARALRAIRTCNAMHGRVGDRAHDIGRLELEHHHRAQKDGISHIIEKC